MQIKEVLITSSLKKKKITLQHFSISSSICCLVGSSIFSDGLEFYELKISCAIVAQQNRFLALASVVI